MITEDNYWFRYDDQFVRIINITCNLILSLIDNRKLTDFYTIFCFDLLICCRNLTKPSCYFYQQPS